MLELARKTTILSSILKRDGISFLGCFISFFCLTFRARSPPLVNLSFKKY